MRILSRTVIILSVISLLADIASEMLYPVLPLYLKEIGFTVLWIGLLEGLANFTAGVSKGYFGKLSDEKGVRLPFVKLGYFLSSISKPMMAFFSWPLWIFFARTLDRLGKGVRTAARDALLSQEATPETKARVFGFHRGMDTLGATIGPMAALVFIVLYPRHYKLIFLLAFIPGILSVLLNYLLKEKRVAPSDMKKGNFFSFFNYWKIATPEYKKLIIGLLIIALFNSSDFFLLIKATEITAGTTVRIGKMVFTADHIAIGAYILYNLVWALTSYPFGSLADRMGMKRVFFLGTFIFCLVYGGFAFAHSMYAVFVLFIIYGLYPAATDGVTKAWITNITKGKNVATAIGFFSSCQSVCSLLASFVAGLIWIKFGSTVTFAGTAIVTFVAAVYLVLVLRDRKKQKNSNSENNLAR